MGNRGNNSGQEIQIDSAAESANIERRGLFGRYRIVPRWLQCAGQPPGRAVIPVQEAAESFPAPGVGGGINSPWIGIIHRDGVRGRYKLRMVFTILSMYEVNVQCDDPISTMDHIPYSICQPGFYLYSRYSRRLTGGNRNK